MFESGAVVCLGLAMWFGKCSWRMRMRLLSHPLAVDILVFTILTIVHWGTFSGVMAATVGALMTSVLLTCGRKAFGYMEQGKYKRGMWDMSSQLMQCK
jgi:hypothetical protein